jgi:hypothetical protein
MTPQAPLAPRTRYTLTLEELRSHEGNEFRYTGREGDGTGLYYYRARYYHPGRPVSACRGGRPAAP